MVVSVRPEEQFLKNTIKLVFKLAHGAQRTHYTIYKFIKHQYNRNILYYRYRVVEYKYIHVLLFRRQNIHMYIRAHIYVRVAYIVLYVFVYIIYYSAHTPFVLANQQTIFSFT